MYKTRIAQLTFSTLLLASFLGCTESQTSTADPVKFPPKAFYVSPEGNDFATGTRSEPFKTIQRAQQVLRESGALNVKGTVYIWLAGGRYELTEPLVFTALDSGSDNTTVIYQAMQGHKPILSGGRRITDWKQGPNGLWQAYIKDVHDGSWWFRQLFADGKRLPRSRYPNEDEPFLTLKSIDEPDAWSTRQKFVLNQEIPFGNMSQSDTEAVFLHYWSISRNYVRESDNTSFLTQFTVGIRNAPALIPRVEISRLFFENNFAFIDRPGEWYLDRDTGIVHLKLAEGQNPNLMKIFAPVLSELLIVKDPHGRQVDNLHFKGLTLEHASWWLPLSGYQGMQAATWSQDYLIDPSYMLPSAVYFENARNCSFREGRIAHTGANALSFGPRCTGSEVVGCEITDIGANGITMGWRDRADDVPRRMFEAGWLDPADTPRNNTVSHNTIHACGIIHFGAVGYFELFSNGCTFSHNKVFDLPYTGVSIGFTWNHLPTTQNNSTVEFNHIHDVMQLLFDGGGVYTLGYQPGSVVRNNLIHNVRNGHGLYTDEGSSRILFENNVVVNAGIYGYQHHYGHSNIIRNNIFYDSGSYAVHHAVEKGKPSYVFERNIVVFDTPPAHEHKIVHSKPAGSALDIILERDVPNRKARMNHNLYFATRSRPITFGGRTLPEWQALGQDIDSLIADPRFKDPRNLDFTLLPVSPAANMGFKPIDLSAVGPDAKYRY